MAIPLHVSHVPLDRQQIQVGIAMFPSVYAVPDTVEMAGRLVHALHVTLVHLKPFLVLMHAHFVQRGSFRMPGQYFVGVIKDSPATR
jgi:hypothetical protein